MRDDPEVFDPRQNEGRPEDIEELDGDETVPELQGFSGGGPGWPVVPYKHGFSPYFRPFGGLPVGFLSSIERRSFEIFKRRVPGRYPAFRTRGSFA